MPAGKIRFSFFKIDEIAFFFFFFRVKQITEKNNVWKMIHGF